MRLLLVIVMISGSAWAQDPVACPEVEIGGAQTYACLNQRLRQFASPPTTVFNLSLPSATAPANETGSASEAGTRERLGTNFGKSARPQRPAPRSFVSPLR